MKARYTPPVSSEVRRITKLVQAEVEEAAKREQDRAISRVIKITCLVLHQDFGFGLGRLERFLQSVFDGSNDTVSKPEEWYRIDERLREIGLEFDPEDLAERERHSRDVYHDQGKKFREY